MTLLVLCLCLLAPPGLNVTVLDARGAPVHRALVSVAVEDNNTTHAGRTGPDGLHAFPGVARGSTIRVEVVAGRRRATLGPSRWDGEPLTVRLTD